jgi:CubicO group peptidase (beta-lactamase class C family)
MTARVNGGGNRRRWVAACVAAGCLAASTVAASTVGAAVGSGTAAEGRAAVVPGDDWVVDDPAAHGMDAGVLEGARDYAFVDGRNTQGVVVVHDGAIVGEWYAPGATEGSWATSWSMAKSFTSALVGVALDEGLIPSIDVPMTTYYPEWAGTPRESITLRHVLHMESGLDWDESYDPADIASSEIISMVGLQLDQLAFAAGRPAEVAPGTRFNYSSGDTMLLSGVIEQATGMSVEEYAQEQLLDPIGIDPLEWWQDAEGHTLTYCCVDTTSRDFARFGLLYLRGGDWDGDQVVPSTWVQASVTDTAASYSGYGYQWWLDGGGGGIPPYFSARGHDGQFIYVIPSLDLVVVRNGTYVKSECPPIADPNLIGYLPSDGLVPGEGTIGPDSWSDEQFLGPIVESLTGTPVDGSGAAAHPGDPAAPAAGPGPSASADAVDPAACPNVAQPPVDSTTTTVAVDATSTTTSTPTPPRPTSAATPVSATPQLTG